MFLVVERIRSPISSADNNGCSDFTSPATPATIGQDILVPDLEPYPPPVVVLYIPVAETATSVQTP